MNRSLAFSYPAVLASLLALAGAIGCTQEEPNIAAKDYPGEIASTYCKAVYSCQCDAYPYASFNECFGDQLAAYDELNDSAYLAGLTYDGTCPAQEVEKIESYACKGSVPALAEGVCVPPCDAWHGSTAAGGLCEYLASSAETGLQFSNCAQGLTCAGGVCINPCQAGAVLPGIGQPCPELVCAAGAMCDETMMCVAQVALPGPGEPCVDGLCDPKRAVCVAEANACAALPTVGQACIQSQCDANSYCGADDVCLARPALACSLLGAGTPGDGDGDPTGDGDGDPTGDGDGDPTGDGDGDPTGDGDGDPTGGGTGPTEEEFCSWMLECGLVATPDDCSSFYSATDAACHQCFVDSTCDDALQGACTVDCGG